MPLTRGLGKPAVNRFVSNGEGIEIQAVTLHDSAGVELIAGGFGMADNADGVAVSATANKQGAQARNSVFNGTTWDRMRGNTTGVFTVARPTTTGGLSMGRIVTGTSGFIKASAGQVYAVNACNINAAIRYLHLYNKATAPTVGTDTPVATIALPPGVSVNVNLADLGAAFAAGIAWAYTTDSIATPATVATSGELQGTVFFG